MRKAIEGIKAAIAQDRELLEKIDPVLRDRSRQDQHPVTKKLVGSLRFVKKTLLNSIKIREKFLEAVRSMEEEKGKAK